MDSYSSKGREERRKYIRDVIGANVEEGDLENLETFLLRMNLASFGLPGKTELSKGLTTDQDWHIIVDEVLPSAESRYGRPVTLGEIVEEYREIFEGSLTPKEVRGRLRIGIVEGFVGSGVEGSGSRRRVFWSEKEGI